MFDATLKHITITSWRPVFLVEEIGVPGENHQRWHTLSHNAVSSRIRTHNGTAGINIVSM